MAIVPRHFCWWARRSNPSSVCCSRQDSRRSFCALGPLIANRSARYLIYCTRQDSSSSFKPTASTKSSNKSSSREVLRSRFSTTPTTLHRVPLTNSFRKSWPTQPLCDSHRPRRKAHNMPTAEYIETAENNDDESIVGHLT